MLYYITENQICVYATNSVKAVNAWLAKRQKTIVSITNNVYHEFIIEVK